MSHLIMMVRVWGLDVSPDHDGKGLRSWCLLDDNGRSVLMLTARRRCNRWPKYLKIVQFLLHYGGGSNTEHDRILNGPKLFRWWMVVFSNGWDFFGPHLVFLCTVSVCEWSVLVHSCSYNSQHSKTKPFQYWSSKHSDFEWVMNLNVWYLSPHCTQLPFNNYHTSDYCRKKSNCWMVCYSDYHLNYRLKKSFDPMASEY